MIDQTPPPLVTDTQSSYLSQNLADISISKSLIFSVYNQIVLVFTPRTGLLKAE